MALTDTDLRPDITLIRSLLAPFSSQQRLYELVLHPAARDDASCPWLQAGSLLVEGFTAVDALHEIGWREIIVLALDGADDASFGSLVGRRASLAVTLADGTRTTFSGLLHEVALLGRDGALARLRLRLVPWLWLLSQRRASRLWQDCSIIDIVDAVFARYAPHAAWHWSGDARTAVAGLPPRPHTAMYRETDLAFVSRLLVQEGISWRIEETEDAPGAHRVVVFADSRAATTLVEDATSAHSLGGAGIGLHDAHAGQQQDSIRRLRPSAPCRRPSPPCWASTRPPGAPWPIESGTKWVADTLERVRARAPGEVPAEPGFCIDGAFIAAMKM